MWIVPTEFQELIQVFKFSQFNTRKKYNHVALVSANIPKTYYAIVSPKNTFILLENSTQITITVTPETYNRNAFAFYLLTLLTSSSLNNWTYTINIPNTNTGPETGYYYFGVTGNSAAQPAFIFNEVGLCQQLGFDSNSTNTFVGNVLTSVNVTNLTAETSHGNEFVLALRYSKWPKQWK